MNILCFGGLTTGVAVAFGLREKFSVCEVQRGGAAPSPSGHSQGDWQADCCLRYSVDSNRDLQRQLRRRRNHQQKQEWGRRDKNSFAPRLQSSFQK
jgi:hypothetical protein